MALDTMGFVPKGNLNTDGSAASAAGRKNTVITLVKYLGRYIPLMVISIALAFTSVYFTLRTPVMIGNAIDYILLIPELVNDGIDWMGSTAFYGFLYYLSQASIYAVIVCATQYVMNLINNRVSYYTVRDLRLDMMRRLQIVDISVLDSHSKGDLLSRMITDADQLADGLIMGFSQTFTGIVTILLTLVFIFRMNVYISLAVVLLTPLSLVVSRFISKRTYEMFKAQSSSRGEMTSIIDEMIGNEKVVKSFGKEERVLERFDELNIELKDTSLKAIFFSSLTNPSTRFVNAVVYALVAMLGCISLLSESGSFLSGSLTVGTLTVFLAYANQYTKPFNEISGVITELQNAIACAARVFEVIEMEPQKEDSVSAVANSDVEGYVAVEDVAFSYVPNKKLIENFNLNVSKGQRIAIVGPTGCGKTTIINLLMRFYDVDKGSIKIDGIDIRDYKRAALRNIFGMVLQDTWLFSGSIKDNLKFVKIDATDEEIVEACKEAHAHSFIRRLENGYDTLIGENGDGLSQGQQQLLCIARLMLVKPQMLILDEATSSIDTRTEVKIQNAFMKLMEGHTAFIVAHRLSTIRNADVILVMRDGQIIESGNHEELYKQNGFYTRLYNSSGGHE